LGLSVKDDQLATGQGVADGAQVGHELGSNDGRLGGDDLTHVHTEVDPALFVGRRERGGSSLVCRPVGGSGGGRCVT